MFNYTYIIGHLVYTELVLCILIRFKCDDENAS